MISTLLLLLTLFASPAEVKTVNPDKPLKGEWNFKLEKTWTIYKAGQDAIAAPSVVVSDDGTVCIRDWKNRSYYLFSDSGSFKRAFGKLGEGPGEIRWHALPSFAVHNTFIAADMDRLHFFNHEGEFIKSIPHMFPGKEPLLFVDQDQLIAAPVFNLPKGKGEIYLCNLKTEEKKVIREFTAGSQDNRRGPVPSLFGLSPMPVVGYDDGNKKLYYGINDSYVIYAVDLNGNILNTFSLERAKRVISEEALKKQLDAIDPGGPNSQTVKLLPRELTHFRKIQIINGLVYIFQDNFGINWDSQQIDIFSPEGQYLYRSVIKPDKGSSIYFSPNNFLIKNGHMYAVLEDAEGEISIVKYKLTLPGLDR
jgi:hypothetical protein